MFQKVETTGELHQLKNIIVDRSLIAFSIFIGIINTIVFYRNIAFDFGFNTAFYIQLANALVIFGATYFRKRLTLNQKVFFFVFAVLAVTISAFYTRGYLSSTKAFIILTPVFLSFVISIRAALYAYLGFTVIYLFGYWSFVTGFREYSFNVIGYISHPITWFVELILISFTSCGFLFIAHYFRKRLENNYIKIEQQNAELSNNEAKYRQLFDCANDAIVVLENNAFVDVNNKACEYFRLLKKELIGKSPGELSPEFQPDGSRSSEKSIEYVQAAFDGNSKPFEWQHLTGNGDIMEFSIILNVVELDNKKYIQGILRDITEEKSIQRELEKYRYNLEELVQQKTEDLEAANQELRETNNELKTAMSNLKEAQSQLVHSEKMASLGVLTAGVAHEINNPLNYILGGYQALEMHYEDEPEKKDDTVDLLLSTIKTGVDRATAIVHGLNQFNRSNDKYDEVCDIHSILENCLLMLKTMYKNKVEIVRNFDAEQHAIMGNSGKLHQVFINIITNSIQAIENQNGKIMLTTSSNNGNLAIEVEDNGSGIEPDHLEKISDPFFTTKNPGEGTGLGLSITFNIIKEHQGTITYNSTLGKGTTAKILLPYE
ncbi:MAG: PAS domain S-box protein [Balneolaceae bacterium]|nr:PAS domain S-box protein [Balneolaceae bacterium]